MIDIQLTDALSYLKTIKDNSIDLILTDPPYLISKDSNFTSGGGAKKFQGISFDFGEWDKKDFKLDLIIKEYKRVLKKGGTIIVFYDFFKITELYNLYIKNKFKQLRIIEWIKTNPVPINAKINYLSGVREIALVGVKGSNNTFNSYCDKGIYHYPIPHSKSRTKNGIKHPTKKPLKLFEDLILKHSNEGDIVLDTFLGSGTTAQAAINTNRIFKGCEINKDYYEAFLLDILNKNK